MSTITIKPGLKLYSAVCDTQIMILRPSSGELDIRCGGLPMLTSDEGCGESEGLEDMMTDSLTGKRYVDAEETVEFLCTRGGAGGLSLGEEPLQVKQAKMLPSSD